VSDKTVVLVGTLDTKGEEYAYLRDRLKLHGVRTLLIDVGTLAAPVTEPDIDRYEVAAATGVDLEELERARDRGRAVGAMAGAAAALVRRLYEEGRCDGVLAAGGSGNTAIATSAMRALPVGVPKLMVSTVAAGDTRDYIGAGDVTLMASVTDVAGINSISARILANAAAAMAGMVDAPPVQLSDQRPLIGATMFGVTTPCVTTAREALENRGYEVLVFHATGTGGMAMEGLIDSGFISGVLDVTTTELCDQLVGGVFPAGPERLEVAGRKGPPQFENRKLYVHNPSVTLMRTTPEECAELGRTIARKLAGARGPVALFLPLKGVSAIDSEGGPFHDPAADESLFEALRENLAPNVELHELEHNINDPEFALAMADRLEQYLDEARG
jgi:uncharacterized protein (UPF0261 family)